MAAIALTDHDTTAGLAACAAGCERAGVRFVPGIELSADPGRPRGTMHILGYFVRHDEPSLLEVTAELHEVRASRNPRIIAALNGLGVDITQEEVEAVANGGVVGRPHIASVLLEKGYVKSIQDAFVKYLGQGGAGYVRKDRLAAERAIDVIHAAGGLAVLAHPVQLRCEEEGELERTVGRLVELGLDGLEAWHSDHAAGLAERYRRLAERFGLIATGGSDYHGSRKAVPLGGQAVDDAVLEQLDEARRLRVG